jgi:hypothetical protein
MQPIRLRRAADPCASRQMPRNLPDILILFAGLVLAALAVLMNEVPHEFSDINTFTFYAMALTPSPVWFYARAIVQKWQMESDFFRSDRDQFPDFDFYFIVSMARRWQASFGIV